MLINWFALERSKEFFWVGGQLTEIPLRGLSVRVCVFGIDDCIKAPFIPATFIDTIFNNIDLSLQLLISSDKSPILNLSGYYSLIVIK